MTCVAEKHARRDCQSDRQSDGQRVQKYVFLKPSSKPVAEMKTWTSGIECLAHPIQVCMRTYVFVDDEQK